ncbi:beta-ketoacyl-[acyl-carrier-protein] synthase family protein [Candidatus Omnitrophota bacterium]
MNEQIAVTGIGIISATGSNKESFWQRVSNGSSAIKPVSGFETAEFNSHTGAEVSNLNFRDYTKRRAIRNIDKISRFSIAAGLHALKDAKIQIDSSNATKMGLVLGSTYGGWSSIAEFHRQMLEYKLKRVDPLLFTNTVPNSPAGQMAIEFGIKGLNNSLSSGLASGTDAIGWGVNYLRLGKAETILAGGAEELSCWSMGSFDKLGWLSRATNGTPELFRPFDKHRNGPVLGEGAAMLVLEPVESAAKRGASIYAQIIGYASVYDAAGDGAGLERAIRLALEEAGISPSEVDYINAEGNADKASDALETAVLKKVFKDAADTIPVTSIKPVIGHTLGAAGAFDAITCVLAMQHQAVPPTINYQEQDTECQLNYAPNKKLANKQINIAISLSFKPNGSCACLVFKKEAAGGNG